MCYNHFYKEDVYMTDEVLKERVLEERKFLHDMSNHIVVAHGMATFVLRVIKDNPSVDKKELDRLEKSINAISKMTELIQERRDLLHTRS
jgi:large-conductance mechanosensitive channel